MEKLSEELKNAEQILYTLERESESEKNRFYDLRLSKTEECLESFKKILSKIMSAKKRYIKKQGKLLLEVKKKYPHLKDEDILTSIDYRNKLHDIKQQIDMCDYLENKTRKDIERCEKEIAKIKRNKQEKIKDVEEIRQDILTTNEALSEYGIISINGAYLDYDWGAYTTREMGTVKRMIATSHEYHLSLNYGVPFNVTKELKRGGMFDPYYYSRFDREDENTPLNLKEQIRKKQAKRELMRKRIEEYPAEYTKQGQIEVNGMAIPMTKKELIESGLDPDMFEWKSLEVAKRAKAKEKTVVTAKSIAHATLGLPKRAFESIRELFTKENEDVLNKDNYDINKNR